MGFRGYQLNSCLPFSVVSNFIELVWVPSDSIACGHVLIRLLIQKDGVNKGVYFHVPGIGLQSGWDKGWGVWTQPYFFSESEFPKYLMTNNKDESRVFRKKYLLNELSKKMVSKKISSLMENKWLYGITTNNCQSFIEELIIFADSNYSDRSKKDCPGAEFNIPDYKLHLRKSHWYKMINFVMGNKWE